MIIKINDVKLKKSFFKYTNRKEKMIYINLKE